MFDTCIFSFVKINHKRPHKYANLSSIVDFCVFLLPYISSHFIFKIYTPEVILLRGEGIDLITERMMEERFHYSKIPNKNIEIL